MEAQLLCLLRKHLNSDLARVPIHLLTYLDGSNAWNLQLGRAADKEIDINVATVYSINHGGQHAGELEQHGWTARAVVPRPAVHHVCIQRVLIGVVRAVERDSRWDAVENDAFQHIHVLSLARQLVHAPRE